MSLVPKRNGILMLGMGIVFPIFFLIGGGVVDSTNGMYWTAVFATSYVVGLVFPGTLVYFSAKAGGCAAKSSTGGCKRRRAPWLTSLVSTIAIGVGMILTQLLIGSDVFTTSLGQHGFLIMMGLGLAQFVPLGLGMLHVATDESVDSTKSPLGPA